MVLNFNRCTKLRSKINFKNYFGVFLEYVHHWARRSALVVIVVGHHHGLAGRLSLSIVWFHKGAALIRLTLCHRSWDSSYIINRLLFLSDISLVAQPLLSMNFQFLEWVSLLASIWALEHQMLENLTHNFVLCAKGANLVTNCAFKPVLVDISFLWSLGEIRNAFSAAPSRTFWALNDVFLDGHAERAFYIFHQCI